MSETDFLEWCGTLFNEPADALTMDTRREDIGGWDSMGMLLLMADLDEIHGIQLKEEELSELKTLRDIASLIEARTPKSG
ncbi:MAG TPA: acyl carrier protein [Longimicrobiales bacterium]|nr:acyl carrier protein [Longimicrobiales bacterium]